MPIHDWTRLEAGDFHDFHQGWMIEIRNALNGGLLPPGYMAMAEQVTGRPIPDVVTLQTRRHRHQAGGTAVKEKPATAQVVSRFEKAVYAKRADRVVIRHGRGRVVAIIEIVSPGIKSSQNPLRTFVEKAVDILNQGVHLLIVDLFPPTPRDPHGLPRLIGEEFSDESFQLLPGKPLTVTSYLASEAPTAYANSVGVGDPLPAGPIFLSDSEYDYIAAPLEDTYNQSWAVFPAFLKEIMETSGSNPLPTTD